MRLLVVAPVYPVPITEGHSLRVRHQLKNFPGDCSFDLVCQAPADHWHPPDRPEAEIGPACRSVTILPHERNPHPPPRRGLAAKVSNVLFPGVNSPGYASSPSLAAAIQRSVDTREHDLVFFSGFSMFLQAPEVQQALPCVVDMIDSYSLYSRNELRTPGPPRQRLRALADYVWAVRYEQLHCARAQNLVLITPSDQRSVQRHCSNSRTWSLPNGVDCDYFHNGSDQPTGHTLLFTGVMDYTPNSDAMVFFIREVLPRVRAELPDTKLTVAGRNPSAGLLEAARAVPGVTVTGFVEDIRPYFRQAVVYVAPMVSGAGLKNKILEAWAMGKPVVATSLARSGLDIEEGTNILVDDEPEGFARKVIRVLTDEALRTRLAASARQTAEDHYSWTRLSVKLREILQDVAKSS